MTNERKPAPTSAEWSRIGDNAFGLGMKRFQDSDGTPLWRLQVTRHSSIVLIDIDAREGDLLEIRRFIDRAIERLRTDGGRREGPAP